MFLIFQADITVWILCVIHLHSFFRPIGSGDPRKVKIKNPPPKKVDENAAASNTEVPTAIVP